MNRLICVIAIAVLAGCSTAPVPDGQAKPIAQDRLLALHEPIEGGAELVVVRDEGWMGGGCYLSVLVDGRIAARIDTGEIVRLYVSPGRHVLGVSGDAEGQGLCGMQIGQSPKETSTEIRSGETQRFRVLVDMNAGIDLRPTAM